MENQIEKMLNDLMFRDYEAQFKVIDGLNQHPDGLTFEQFKKKIQKAMQGDKK